MAEYNGKYPVPEGQLNEVLQDLTEVLAVIQSQYPQYHTILLTVVKDDPQDNTQLHIQQLAASTISNGNLEEIAMEINRLCLASRTKLVAKVLH